MVSPRERHLVHRLVRHVRLDNSGLHLIFEGMKSLGKFLDVTISRSVYVVLVCRVYLTYPLLGPRFIGTRLN